MEKLSYVLNKIVILTVICIAGGMVFFLIKMKAWIFIVLIALVIAVYWNIGRLRKERFKRNNENNSSENIEEDIAITKEKEEA